MLVFLIRDVTIWNKQFFCNVLRTYDRSSLYNGTSVDADRLKVAVTEIIDLVVPMDTLQSTVLLGFLPDLKFTLERRNILTDFTRTGCFYGTLSIYRKLIKQK
jgi:hypothetical protein